VPSAQVELLNAAPEALDVLLGADARDLVAELEQSPELLSLLTVPEVAEDLQFRPEALAQYRFATELDTEPERWTGRGFEAAFGSYLDTLRGLPGLRTEFSAATQNRLREAARVTWARFQSGRASTADEEHARQQRLASFNALQPGTWVMSKQIHYGGKLTEESFTPTQTQVLHRLAELAVQPQEGRFVLNVALHAHLDGGDQGVSFAYVKLPSGEVGLYPYSVSGGRSGNDYWWQHAPTGRRYVRGPLDIEAVYNEPILKESRRLVSEASAASASALTAMAGQPEEAAVALDETTRSLIQVLKDYHAPSTASLSATSVAGTSNPRGRGARRPTATGTADARAAAEVRLRQLGVDLRHRAAVWRALADDRLAGSQTVAADAAGRRRAARERDDLAAELYAAAEEGAAV
jgi:hypothetical protein